MTITTLSSRELNHDVSSAKKGKPSHVLMTYDEFCRLSGKRCRLTQALAMPGLSDIDFDPPRVEIAPRGVDLS